ncbi:MAG: outer membrane protein OmpA-like peptidoglycan-associated protein, partial [Maribacter sp.]
DSYGGTDIYYVTTNNGQIMSAPTNLGPRINSPGNEISPYLFNGDLYFSSDVFYGFGGMDIYKSNLQANGTYSIPVNLGEGINTSADDFGFIIKEMADDAYLGYLASNRKGGKGGDDIYGFRINGIPGLKTFALQGEVLNTLTQKGISQVQISVVDAQGVILKEIYTKEDGTFTLEIPWQEQVTIAASKEKYSIFSTTFKEEDMDNIQDVPFLIGLVLFDDFVEEKEGQIALKLDKFYFDKGKSVINTSIAAELDKVVETAIQFPQLRLAIETHTDSRNSSSYNLKLSQNRADAIKAYLIKKGVSQATIVESLGYGEEKLTNNCINGAYCLDFLHKQNERTLIKIVR